MTDDLAIKLLSAALAVSALILSIINFIRTSRVSDRQYRLAFSQDVYKWSGEMLQLFKELHIVISTVKARSEAREGLSITCYKVSVLWGKGRFLFPNVEKVGIGTEKEAAFQGYRRPILDQVAEFHRLLRQDIDYLDRLEEFRQHELFEEKYIQVRRLFVTEAQLKMATKERFKLAGMERIK